jgi:predicted NBD/HSP70 family sugar kinase
MALEIGVDSLAAAHVGPAGEIIALGRADRPRGRSSVAEIVADLATLAKDVHPATLAPDALIGVGVAVAGVVRREDGLVRTAPNLGWRDVALAEPLARALAAGVPVTVANDADLGALAESRRGAAMGADDVVYVSGEVGIGGGIIVGGRPLAGAAGYGGEVGHIPVNPEGAPCHCGSTGCWETEIGEDVLLRLAGQHERGGQAALDLVLAAADAGEPRAQAAVDHIGHWLGIGLAGLVNIFDPRLIVLGGRFARLTPYVSAMVEAELDRHALAAPRDLVKVVPATLGDHAPLLGAAELAFEPLLADPAVWLGHRAGDAERGGSSSTDGDWRVVA